MNAMLMCMDANNAADKSAEMLLRVAQFNPENGAYLCCTGTLSKMCLSEGGGPGHT